MVLTIQERLMELNRRLADLRLSEELVELLRNGRVDNALLLDLAAHRNWCSCRAA